MFGGKRQEDERLHDVLRGFKMTTIDESRVSSMTSTVGLRSGVLPPISRDDQPEVNSNHSSSNSNNSNNNSIYVRVSSGLSL